MFTLTFVDLENETIISIWKFRHINLYMDNGISNLRN